MSAKLSSNKIDVATTASWESLMFAVVPNYKATAVIKAEVKSHNKLWLYNIYWAASLWLANNKYFSFAFSITW